MYGLYCALMLVMLGPIGRDVWGPDFMRVYGVVVLGIGLVATVIYHRSRSILASVTYSTIMAPWLLNLLYHF
jgi:membrane protease YdiL (CAAX protease family)